MSTLLTFVTQPWHNCHGTYFLWLQEVHSSHWHQEMEVHLRACRHWSRCRKISTRAIEPCSNEEMGWDREGPWLCPRHPQSLSSPVSWKLLTWQSTVNQKWQPLLSHLIFAAQGPKVKSSVEGRSREDIFWVFDRAWPILFYQYIHRVYWNTLPLKQEFGTQFFKKLEPYSQDFGFILHLIAPE